MIKIRPYFFTMFLIFLVFLVWIGAPVCAGYQETGMAVEKDLQKEGEPDKIVAAPKDAKEKTGIWVFVVWMWFSIIVLVYFLRLKIEEVDRLYGLGFFSTKKN